MEKLINQYQDKLDSLEEVAEATIDKIIDKIDINSIIDAPDATLEELAVLIKAELEKLHPKAAELGIGFAERVQKYVIKVKIKGEIKFPKIDLGQELNQIADNVVIRGLKDGIRANRDIEGKAFPPLERSTVKAKGNSEPLIDTGVLLNSFYKVRKRTNDIRIKIKAIREEIARSLQIEGVGRKKKKFFFFGITERMEKDAIKIVHNKIKRVLING